MRTKLRMMAIGAVLMAGFLMMTVSPVDAGCGGGGGGGYGRAGARGGHTFNAGYGGRESGCGMACMNMADMNMGGMNMAAPGSAAPTMAGMNMAPAAPRAAAPTAAPASTAALSATVQYHCPMHPNVMSTFPATCPYCRMALVRR